MNTDKFRFQTIISYYLIPLHPPRIHIHTFWHNDTFSSHNEDRFSLFLKGFPIILLIAPHHLWHTVRQVGFNGTLSCILFVYPQIYQFTIKAFWHHLQLLGWR